jgi:hypothetical protein
MNFFFHKTNAIKVFVVFLLVIGLNTSTAQSYLKFSAGYVDKQYKPLHPDKLDRDEHDFINGLMLDVELGKRIKRKKISYLYGIKARQIKENVKGIYTQYQINPDADIEVYSSSLLLTTGIKIPIWSKLELLLQLSFGPKYTLWYQDGTHRESFWKYNLPLDIGIEYQLFKKWNLVFGTSISAPIYISRSTIFYGGIVKQF